MSIQAISFYQQDQNYWQTAHAESQVQSANSALINVMGQAEVNKAKGLARIANGTALNRVNSALTAAVQAALGQTSSSGASPTGSSSTTAAAKNTSPSPASGIGTVPLSASTPLSTLGFLVGGTFSVDDGTNITKYTSTGNDTVADLINAINSGPAFVIASLNNTGKLVITGRNTKEIVTVAGSGNDAAALGFGINNNSFTPKAPASAASSPLTTASASTTANPKSASSTSSGKTSSVSIGQVLSSSAASILSASGVSGSLIDMLA